MFSSGFKKGFKLVIAFSGAGYHELYNGVVCNDTILATGVFSSKELWMLSKGTKIFSKTFKIVWKNKKKKSQHFLTESNNFPPKNSTYSNAFERHSTIYAFWEHSDDKVTNDEPFFFTISNEK